LRSTVDVSSQIFKKPRDNETIPERPMIVGIAGETKQKERGAADDSTADKTSPDREGAPLLSPQIQAQKGRNHPLFGARPPRTPWLSPAVQLRLVTASNTESIARPEHWTPVGMRKRDQSEITRLAGALSHCRPAAIKVSVSSQAEKQGGDGSTDGSAEKCASVLQSLQSGLWKHTNEMCENVATPQPPQIIMDTACPRQGGGSSVESTTPFDVWDAEAPGRVYEELTQNLGRFDS
jgi:hypothetical protein